VSRDKITVESWPKLANLIWMTVPAGMLISAVLVFMWWRMFEHPPDQPRYVEVGIFTLMFIASNEQL
jgi:hypothetical protein